MRTEQEMMALILSTAQADERIRAVILNGSRANPQTRPDRFQDFDVTYIVTEVAPFINDDSWIDRFGERMILQTPDVMTNAQPREDEGFTYLMQFMDGNRIDLEFITRDHYLSRQADSLSVLLLDKDSSFNHFPPPSEESYLPSPPSAKAFADCCNEFWWVAPYAAKGLARDEILYARYMLDVVMRKQLMLMLTWYFGIKTCFTRSPGKIGKHFQEVLSPMQWRDLLNTYSDAGKDATWQALMTMCALFKDIAQQVAQNFQFCYPEEDDNRVSAYLVNINKTTQ